MKGRLLPWLCCLLILAGLSGSAAQTAFPLPPPSSDSETTASEPAEAVPAVSGASGAVPVESPSPDGGAGVPTESPSPDSGVGVPTESPSPDTGADDTLADASSGNPDGADSPAVTQVLGTTQPTPLGVPGSWHLVFDDEFDILNTAVWTPYWFNDCNPKSVMNNVKTCSSNVRVANGEAVLQLSDAESGALLSTNPKDGVPGHAGFEFTSGYVEARIHFPGTCSSRIPNWPAWWTVGQRFPHTGEIDIAEALAGDVESVYHSADGTKSRQVSGCWAGSYHTYGLYRKAGVNDIYYDGRRVHSYASSDGNSPHYLILNVGVSAGPRIFGERGSVKVDYVRAWQ